MNAPRAKERATPGTKSGSAFRTISEVSGDLGVAAHVLRFWETKFPQVKPLKRGGGRRYYRPEDVALLRGIQGMLYEDGYSIKGVQKYLRENGARALADPQAPTRTPEPAQAPAPASPDSLDDGQREQLETLLQTLLRLRSEITEEPGDK